MKVIVENHIPYIKGVLEPFATVEYLPYAEFTPATVADADALVVRTRTRCDEALLGASRCSFVGSATIGTDHIDINYCKSHGIAVRNAPGCNAPAVAQYVLSIVGRLLHDSHVGNPGNVTLGIVGVGHVGSIIARWATQLGLKVLLNDPPRQRTEADFDGVSLDEVAENADVVTFHTPFTRTGIDATYHLCDHSFVEKLSHCRLLINSARGPITDTHALLHGLKTGKIGDVAIDCWENEPRIDGTLLKSALVATPHIAGYSQEGKMRATAMIVEALNEHFGWNAVPPTVSAPAKGATEVSLGKIVESYDPFADTEQLKTMPEQFEALRNFYPLRHEVQ